jgi:hypothetical protein
MTIIYEGIERARLTIELLESGSSWKMTDVALRQKAAEGSFDLSWQIRGLGNDAIDIKKF